MKLPSIFLLLVISLSLTSCYSDGPKVYGVKSVSTIGKQKIRDFGIKYVSKKTFSIMAADFSESKEGYFALNVRREGGQIKFDQLKPHLVNAWELKPAYSLWQSWGWILVVILMIVGACLGVFFSFD
ncbi:hypothetical protein BKI52_15845 [marine bacterium AO1-C]|nr:hypothetical protein BKI52_15845 [marine bacterium AO1-C]